MPVTYSGGPNLTGELAALWARGVVRLPARLRGRDLLGTWAQLGLLLHDDLEYTFSSETASFRQAALQFSQRPWGDYEPRVLTIDAKYTIKMVDEVAAEVLGFRNGPKAFPLREREPRSRWIRLAEEPLLL